MNLQELKSAAEAKDLYLPVMAEITGVRKMTDLENLYTVRLPGGADLGHKPGQFVEVSVFGVGEAPFSISSSPTRHGEFELGIRRVGMLTEVLAGFTAGQRVGIRGPFGNGVDVTKFAGKDVLIVAGGIGLVPMRSVINYRAGPARRLRAPDHLLRQPQRPRAAVHRRAAPVAAEPAGGPAPHGGQPHRGLGRATWA